MRLRPRHYILIGVILLVGLVNLIGSRRRRLAHPAPAPVAVTPSGPRPDSPAWQAFDKAASLRDAPSDQFAPAAQSLSEAMKGAHDPDLPGCQTWLLFYRQGVRHASAKDPWKPRSDTHLDGCMKYHRDLSS